MKFPEPRKTQGAGMIADSKESTLISSYFSYIVIHMYSVVPVILHEPSCIIIGI